MVDCREEIREGQRPQSLDSLESFGQLNFFLKLTILAQAQWAARLWQGRKGASAHFLNWALYVRIIRKAYIELTLTFIFKLLIAPQQRFELPILRSIALLMDLEFHGSEFQGLLISTSQLR